MAHPVMPIWTDRLIADTTHLSAREFGAYMLLLLATWRNNGQPFPDADKILARICRLTTFEWKTQIRKTIEPFFDVSGGFWRQERLETEWIKCNAKASSSRRNGALGGRPTAAKPQKLNGSDNLAGFSQVNPEETQTETIPSLNNSKTVRAKALTPSTKAVEAEFSKVYEIYPRHTARGAALKAFTKARQAVELQPLLDAVARFAKQRAGEPREYTPHMATWLNQQRWLDEDAPMTNGHDELPAFWAGYPDPVEVHRESQWAARLKSWAEKPRGFWSRDWGGRPDEIDCAAPHAMRLWAVQHANLEG